MSAQVPPLKRNNYLPTSNIIQQMKYLLILETLFGINRLYICGYRKWILWLSYIYDVMLHILVGFLIIISIFGVTHQYFYKITTGVEYMLLSFSALFLQRKKMSKFFKSLQTFDDNLNIGMEVSQLSPKRWYLSSLGILIVYSVLENFYCVLFVFQTHDLSMLADLSYLSVMAHDVEIVLFCYLLVTILRRLSLLKAHVAKVFSINMEGRIDCEDSNKLEALSNRVNLSVSSAHRLYDLLHKCSEELSSIMSLSMIVMIVTSGLSTIFFLKNTINLFQSTTTHPSLNDKHQLISRQATLIFSIGRSLKYIFMLTFPCYISNKTQNQVAVIRTMIYDTLNSIQLDKVERRKVKAFFQLVCENKFAYALYGIISLDMSLPLSFSSLCTTYLIIVVQFSKFFD